MQPSSSSSDRRGARLLWVRVDQDSSWKKRKEAIQRASEAGAELVVIDRSDYERVRMLWKKPIGVIGPRPGDLPEDVLPIDLDPEPKQEPRARVALQPVAAAKDQQKVMDLLARYETVIVDCRDWRIIPLENLIAAAQSAGSKILATVSGPEDASVAIDVLERGVDGVLLEPKHAEDIPRVAEILRGRMPPLEMIEAEVVSLAPVGPGDRACIDTCSLLEHGEGLLVGSQADGMVLVHAETIETEYVQSRPFRINAGAIHSYVLSIRNTTRYLSDLRSGDPALIVRFDGSTRIVTIGRVKIETRPLSMVRLRHGGREFGVILQNAETIRLVRPDGTPVAITDLKVGDRVVGYVSGEARHFGMSIQEKLIER